MGPGGDKGDNSEVRSYESLLDSLITGEETWMHLTAPKMNQDSMTWKRPSLPSKISKFNNV